MPRLPLTRLPFKHGPGYVPSINSRRYRQRLDQLAAHLELGGAAGTTLALETRRDQRARSALSKVLPRLQARARGRQTRALRILPTLRVLRGAMKRRADRAKILSSAATKIASMVRGKLSRKKNTRNRLSIAKKLYQLGALHTKPHYKELAAAAAARWKRGGSRRASAYEDYPIVYGPGF